MDSFVDDVHIGVVGLGYVGLPLAVAFGKQLPVIGYDINASRIEELGANFDRTREVDSTEFSAAKFLTFTSDASTLKDVNVYIVTTPTPIDEHKKPDLRHILSATRHIGRTMNSGDIVIYESTVYPGATEEECVSLLEKTSGLKFNEDFFVGYSPERINPGDKVNRLETIVKVTSGSTPRVADFVDHLYRRVVHAGTHRAPSIKVAEAAKVIENTQRDVNIAFINELSLLFGKMGIDTQDVLAAASTKWNFLPFQPGLVGGHCIGVDPYYLTHKAQAVGYHPEIILAGRRLNDSMGGHVASELVKAMLKSSPRLDNARVLVLGLTFKENTPDLRNTRVMDVVRELEEYGLHVDVHDPWADPAEADSEYGVKLLSMPNLNVYDGIVLAVAHQEFVSDDYGDIRQFGKQNCVIYDLKGVLPNDMVDIRL